MAYGTPYDIPQKKKSALENTGYFLSEYLIPFLLGYLLLKVTKVFTVAVCNFFDPDLSDYYYDPNPLWLSY